MKVLWLDEARVEDLDDDSTRTRGLPKETRPVDEMWDDAGRVVLAIIRRLDRIEERLTALDGEGR